VIIQLARLMDGSRKIISFQEISGMEGEIITMQEIFSFEQTGVGTNGMVKGKFRATGVRPKFIERFRAADIPISGDFFNPDKIYEL
jgi:pilus assembly protein CpaF